MSSIQERLQLKRVPLDTWNVREQLCLASAVVRSGDQNWMSVSRALKTVGEPNRPNDWYSQKSCAAQYGALLEHVETPKRKKRSSEGAAETPQESILKRLTQERIVEIQKNIAEITQQYEQIQNEILETRNASTSEERLRDLWTGIETAKRARERENARRAAWLKEREEKRARAERTWRPTTQTTQGGVGVPSSPVAPSSPLLTSLLKSSPVVTTPQHISHPANVVDCVSPSAGAPTLSLLLESPGHHNKHAAIEHIKSQLVQIEHQLKASGSTPPPAPLSSLPAVDIDDIDIKPEDVYAFRDIDIPIPPLAQHHNNTRPPETQLKIDDHEPADISETHVLKEEPSVQDIPEPTQAPQLAEQSDRTEPKQPETTETEDTGVKISFPEVKFPTPEIKVIQDEIKVKEEVKEPEVVPPEPESEPEVVVDVENEPAIVEEDERPQPESLQAAIPASPGPSPDVVGDPPTETCDIPLPPEPAVIGEVTEEEAPLPLEPEPTPVVPEPEVTSPPVPEDVPPETEDVPDEKIVEAIKKEEEVEEASLEVTVKEEAPPEPEVKEEIQAQLDVEETHTETDDDTPMELSREEEKDGKKRRDYSRKKKPDSRACSGSESAAEASAPESPSASDAERQHKLWKKSVMLVYSRLCAHKYASLFLRPISDEEAPGYSMVVRRPMDLGTVRRNIEAGTIRTTAQFQRDVLLMLSNALMYNSSEHSVYSMAQDMHREAQSQLGMLVAAQAHAGLAPPARRKRRRPESPAGNITHKRPH